MPKPTQEPMNINERRKYVQVRKACYQKAGRAERSRLLTELEQETGLHRKSLVRLCMLRAWSARSAPQHASARMEWPSSR
jgi:hypothetical protein